MPAISAILHTHNDALRIARAIESLRPCDEVLVIDHGSSDETREMAGRFGARVIEAPFEAFDTHIFLTEVRHDWVLCLQPSESASEGLESSLLEWKLANHPVQSAFGFFTLVETAQGWSSGTVEARLIHRAVAAWDGWRPLSEGAPTILEGQLLRLRLP